MLRAQALLFSSDLEQSAKHLREALRLDPDAAEAGRALKKVRKLERHVEAAKKASFARVFSAAVQEYTAALEAAEAPQHAPLAATMYAERNPTPTPTPNPHPNPNPNPNSTLTSTRRRARALGASSAWSSSRRASR